MHRLLRHRIDHVIYQMRTVAGLSMILSSTDYVRIDAFVSCVESIVVLTCADGRDAV